RSRADSDRAAAAIGAEWVVRISSRSLSGPPHTGPTRSKFRAWESLIATRRHQRYRTTRNRQAFSLDVPFHQRAWDVKSLLPRFPEVKTGLAVWRGTCNAPSSRPCRGRALACRAVGPSKGERVWSELL